MAILIDPLLYAVLDTVRAAGFGWDEATSNIMPDGHPAPRCGDWFLAIHQGPERGTMMNALNEYYAFTLTLTRRVSGVPLDRIGDRLLCNRLALKLAKETGFNARAHQLKTFLHMNWTIIGLANQYLTEMFEQQEFVNGFSEPAHWEHTEFPKLVGGEWFEANPQAADVGITAEIRFADARILQAIGTYS